MLEYFKKTATILASGATGNQCKEISTENLKMRFPREKLLKKKNPIFNCSPIHEEKEQILLKS